MATKGKTCRHSRRPQVGSLGRLVWACLVCRDRPGSTGIVTKKTCSMHGKGDHIKRIRQ